MKRMIDATLRSGISEDLGVSTGVMNVMNRTACLKRHSGGHAISTRDTCNLEHFSHWK